MTATKFSWLHLTDFHQGMKGQSILWPSMRERFLDDLRNMYEWMGGWNAIFFTGDLTQKGAEFSDLNQTIDLIRQNLKDLGTDPVLLCVPGNHDLVRPKQLSPCHHVLSRFDVHEEIQQDFWGNVESEYRERAISLFDNYEAWWADHRKRIPPEWEFHAGVLPGDWSVRIPVADRQIGVVGLNSAFTHFREGDVKGCLSLNSLQFHRACATQDPAWLSTNDINFLLTHHGPDWLTKESKELYDSTIYPPGNFVAHLYGHAHTGEYNGYSRGGGTEQRYWQGRSLFGLEKDRHGMLRQHGYSAGEVRFEDSIAFLRLWSRKAERNDANSWSFTNDSSLVDPRSDNGTQPQPLMLKSRKRAPQKKNDKLTSAWAEVAQASELWQSYVIENSVEKLLNSAMLSLNSLGESRAQWESDVLTRTYKNLYLLIASARERWQLNSDEICILLLAPLMREAVARLFLPSVLSVLKRIGSSKPQPLSPEMAPIEEGIRGRYPRLIRHYIRLCKSDAVAAREVAELVAYNYIFSTAQFWQTSLQTELASVFADHSFTQAFLTFPYMMKYARCTGGASDWILSEHKPQDRIVSVAEVGTSRIRELHLASLLCVAGHMSLDPRTLPTIVPEHVGYVDSIDLNDLRDTVGRAKWSLPPVRTLQAECGHPAIDVALRTAVVHMDQLLGDLRKFLVVASPPIAEQLPERFFDGGDIVPKIANGAPVYLLPHTQLTIDEDSIMSLLMGRQLYGDPALAIRELYQNALDACRIRSARQQYLAAKSMLIPDFSGWIGSISFRTGVDEDGRDYLECEDNGVGMGRHELEHHFARAGSRFHDSGQFANEVREWRSCGIKFYPNSRFGIGVFSYFMLADEIHLETRRFERGGSLGDSIFARISGGGKLFRIKMGHSNRGAGTRVRLYFNETQYRISALDALRQFVWVAECPLTVIERGTVHDWPVGRLFEESGKRAFPTEDPQLWWTESSGAVLSDGIFVQSLANNYGVVLNTLGDSRPLISVDRNKILPESKSRWMAFQNGVTSANSKSLVNGSFEISAYWILKASLHARVKVELQLGLYGRSISLRPGSAKNLDLATTGLCRQDTFFFDASHQADAVLQQLNRHIEGFAYHRYAVWAQAGLDMPASYGLMLNKPVPDALTGYMPCWFDIDIIVLAQDAPSHAKMTGVQVISRQHVAVLVAQRLELTVEYCSARLVELSNRGLFRWPISAE
jgi:hypothetical protein